MTMHQSLLKALDAFIEINTAKLSLMDNQRVNTMGGGIIAVIDAIVPANEDGRFTNNAERRAKLAALIAAQEA